MSKEIHELIGKYMVCKNRTKPNFDINSEKLFGTHITYNGKRIDEIWCPMLIRESPYHDIEYKVLLEATGLYKGFVIERPWYSCDIESRCRYNKDIKLFDDYDEALEYTIKMNEIEYPSKKLTIWENIVKFFTQQNN